MVRYFAILAIFAFLMALIAGGSAYWFSLMDVNQAKQSSAKVVAQGVSMSIANKLEILQATVDNVAGMESVVAAMESGDAKTIHAAEGMIDNLIPHIKKARLLLPTVNEIDQSVEPHMGYADLEMVQATLNSPQKPFIQGQKKNRHLAITSLIKNSQGVSLGVLLASLDFNFIHQSVKQAGQNVTALQIKQENVVLATAGAAGETEETENLFSDQLRIPNSRWKIEARTTDEDRLAGSNLVFSLIGISSGFIFLAFFVGYRQLTKALRQDHASIIKVSKDLINNSSLGSYPLLLAEMKPVVSTLVQYKRVIDNPDDSDFEISEFEDDFLEQGLDTGFLTNFDEPTAPSEKPEQGVPIDFNKLQSVEQSPGNVAKFTDIDDVDLPVENVPDRVESSIFKTYDIRGIVDQSLTQELVKKIGQAIGSEALVREIKTIVIARDGRLSSESFSEALAQGIITTGCDVLDIGLAPTPLLYFVAHYTEGQSGVMVTGSHNPPNYNGLKVVLEDLALAGEAIQALKRRVDNEDFTSGALGKISENSMFVNEYIGTISEDIHIMRPMKVVLDCGNGSAGEVASLVLKTIGCDVIEMNCDVDGAFPNHHPDPSQPENLMDLIAAVKHYQAEVGIALDGDGDRIGVVDAKGKIIWPDRQMMLFAKSILAEKAAAQIIFDVKCSSDLASYIAKLGGQPLMWKSGHSLIKAKMAETGAMLAGEMSGHICFKDRWFGFDDAVYAAARLIEILSQDSRDSHDVFNDFPEKVSTPEINVPVNEGEASEIIRSIMRNANFPDAEITDIDGLRADFEDGWGLVRASNTTPSLVVRFEGDDNQAMEKVQAQFKQVILAAKSDINLPF